MPSLNFFTGTHTDYHRPSDTADKINYEDLDRVVDFAAAIVAARSTSSTEAPAFTKVEQPDAGRREPRRRARLHRHDSRLLDRSEGLLLGGVIGGGPAEQAGLQKGDVIVEIAGQTIANIYDYTYALEVLKIGEPAKVVYMRDGERQGNDADARGAKVVAGLQPCLRGGLETCTTLARGRKNAIMSVLFGGCAPSCRRSVRHLLLVEAAVVHDVNRASPKTVTFRWRRCSCLYSNDTRTPLSPSRPRTCRPCSRDPPDVAAEWMSTVRILSYAISNELAILPASACTRSSSRRRDSHRARGRP